MARWEHLQRDKEDLERRFRSELRGLRSRQQGELVEEMELGSLVYLDKGRWLLTLREPISVQACFSSFYKPKEADDTKREPEKKKKAKCSIL